MAVWQGPDYPGGREVQHSQIEVSVVGSRSPRSFWRPSGGWAPCDLVARAERVTLPGIAPFDGFTLNGQTPGPTIRARAGDLVEVAVTNENVRDGMTLHWHGVDLPNGMDGVAGVTQDAIASGRPVRVPVRRAAGDLLVPLAPGAPSSGDAAGCSGRWSWTAQRPIRGSWTSLLWCTPMGACAPSTGGRVDSRRLGTRATRSGSG